MKKLLVLGASYTQTPLFQRARKLGVQTVAMSIPGNYPGFELADESVKENIADVDEVIKAAREHQVDGVITCGLDLGMKAIGAACEELGLPGPSRLAAKKASNKYDMKQALIAAGVQTAKYFMIRNEEELEEAMDKLTFPVILKAVDLMGGRGIYRSNTREEARINFRQSMADSHQDYCLIEEFIIGEIFGVEGMIQNGKILYLLPNNIEAFEGATPMPVGHSAPYRYMDTLGGQIREQVEKAVAALGLDNCPLNCDFIRRGDKVYVIELTGRPGANGIPEMVSIYYGVDYYELIVRMGLGEDVSGYFAEPVKGVANLSHTFFTDRKGILRSIKNDNPVAGDIFDLSFNVAPGDEVRPYTNGRDRIGQVMVMGEDLPYCERRLQEIQDRIHVQLEGDLPISETPIQQLKTYSGENQIYCKREDCIPFSFGGNKARFAESYLEDMQKKGCTGLIIYGGYHSNLCRILTAACQGRGIPCSMVHNIDDAEPDATSMNAMMICGGGLKEYRCHKSGIADAVQAAMDDMEKAGLKPYYIHGNKFGQGNAHVPMQAYVDVYREIQKQEKEINLHFDYIFLASSTNLTQSGLLAAHLMEGDQRKIVGISATRLAPRAISAITDNLKLYQEKTGAAYKLCTSPEILFEDKYLSGGYGEADEALLRTLAEAYQKEGICLDPTYSGKGFRGMIEYLKDHRIQGANVLFLHTGGTPLFMDALPDICKYLK